MLIRPMMFRGAAGNAGLVWSTTDKTGPMAVSADGITATNTAASLGSVRGTVGRTTGGVFTLTNTLGGGAFVGLATAAAALSTTGAGIITLRNQGSVYVDGPQVGTASGFGTGSVIRIRLSDDGSQVFFTVDGGTETAWSRPSGNAPLFPIFSTGANNVSMSINGKPEGFTPWS